MSTRPTLAIDTYRAHVSDTGIVTWPDSPQQRTALARALYGAQLIADFDYWLSHAADLLENPAPREEPVRRWNDAYRREMYFRDGLASLSTEQKKTVRKLMRTIAHGILFSSLVTIDQGDFGKFVLALQPKHTQANEGRVEIAPEESYDLHDELNDWLLSFSIFAADLIELVEVKGGWQFQSKE